MKKIYLIFLPLLLLVALDVRGGGTLTGEGTFIYTDYKPLADKPVKVWYYVPEDKPDAEVLVVMHGNSRNAEGYWNAMLEHAKKHQFLLIVPEFSTEYFRSSRDYHQGGVFRRDGGEVNEKYWTFSLIEPLFDYVKAQTGNTRQDYFLYGFSAGSQFVHRFLMFHPQNRVSRAVAAGAGTYTMPDVAVEYSYGLKNTKLQVEDLSAMLQKDVTILVGDADTVLGRTDLVKTPIANRQGRDRVARAHEFYRQAKTAAAQIGVPFRWNFGLVPHAGHSQSQMAASVVDILFGSKQLEGNISR